MSTLKTNTIIPVSGGILSVSGGLSAGDCTANGVSAGTAYFSRGVTVASPLFVSGGATFSASTNFTGNVTALGLAIGQSTAPETGISFEINGPSRHDVPVQPTVAADTGSIVYRDVLMVAQSSGTGWVSGTTSGALVIVAPKTWSNTMLRLEIDGFDYGSDTGGWAAVVSGYPYIPTTSWVHQSQYIDGSPPFSQIRLGYHDTLGKVCFILGDSSSSWYYPKVHIKSVMASLIAPTGWGHGWTAYWEANPALPGISAGSLVNCTPRGNTRLRNGNYGIGTTAPASTLDVRGNSTVNGSANSGTLLVSNTTNSRQIQFGINDTSSVGWIEGWVPGIGGLNLAIQPSGGRLGIGTTGPTTTLDVNGGVNVGGGVTAASVSVTNTTASTSTATGALVVTGGVGVSGAVNVGSTMSFNSGYGSSAPVYGCRGWITINGNAAAASAKLAGSPNITVSSISGGVYSFGISPAMPDANYAIMATSSDEDSGSSLALVRNSSLPTTTAFTLSVINAAAGTAVTPSRIYVSLFR